MRSVRITQSVVYMVTALAVALGVFLNIAFANGKFSLSNLWGEHYYAENTLWTYLSIVFVAAIGYLTAAAAAGGRCDAQALQGCDRRG